MMLSALLQALIVVSGLVIVAQCLCALNHMTIRTRNSVRIAYLTLLMCAAAAALSPLYDTHQTIGDACLLLGVAVFIAANQRRPYLLAAKQ